MRNEAYSYMSNERKHLPYSGPMRKKAHFEWTNEKKGSFFVDQWEKGPFWVDQWEKNASLKWMKESVDAEKGEPTIPVCDRAARLWSPPSCVRHPRICTCCPSARPPHVSWWCLDPSIWTYTHQHHYKKKKIFLANRFHDHTYLWWLVHDYGVVHD